MILVLRNADFSANNIGQVEVTTELNTFTRAAIEASGNASLTDVQKSALNTFFKKIGAFGTESNIWSKMQKVYLPILAGDVSKAAYNYVSSQNDATPTDTYWQLRNKGIVGAVSSMPTSGEGCLASTGITDYLPKVNNFSFFQMQMETPVSGNNAFGLYIQGNGGSNRFGMQINKAGSGDANIVLSAISPSGTIAYGVGNGDVANTVHKLVGISISGGGTDEIETLQANGTQLLKTDALVSSFGTNDTALTWLAPFSTSTLAGISKDAASVGIVMAGSALSSAEMSTLKEATDALALVLTTPITE